MRPSVGQGSMKTDACGPGSAAAVAVLWGRLFTDPSLNDSFRSSSPEIGVS